MKTRVVKFNDKTREKYKREAGYLKRSGYVSDRAPLYIGLFCDGKLVSGIWIDEYDEMFYVTYSKYRRRGFVTRLLKRTMKDVRCGKLDRLIAFPFNEDSMRILKRIGFWKTRSSDYLYKRVKK